MNIPRGNPLHLFFRYRVVLRVILYENFVVKFYHPMERPNFFLAFRINNTSIVHAAEEIQNSLCQTHPEFASGRIRATQFHLTLFVVKVTNTEELRNLYTVLTKALPDIVQFFPFKLNFRGINQFSNCRVIWAKVTEDAEKEKARKVVCVLNFCAK